MVHPTLSLETGRGELDHLWAGLREPSPAHLFPHLFFMLSDCSTGYGRRSLKEKTERDFLLFSSL